MKTRMTISTLPGSTPMGSVSGEVRSHTEAWTAPTGGERYKGFVWEAAYEMLIRSMTDESSPHLYKFDGVIRIIVGS